MPTLLVFLLGLASGSGGTAAWLLSEPDSPSEPLDLQARIETLKGRVQRALSDGERAGKATEDHLRRQFDSYRPQSAQR